MFSGQSLVCWRGSRRVFDGLGFSAGEGNTLLLTGSNGSGKSSLLRLMSGLLKPVSGKIFWDGTCIQNDGDGHSARLCLVTQDDPVKASFSVFEQLSFWAKVSGADCSAENIKAALARMGLERIANAQGKSLSAGQKRRLNLCRLFLKPNPLWLLDEPLTALDAASSAVIQAEIGKHVSGGGIAVIATHEADIFSGNARILAL